MEGNGEIVKTPGSVDDVNLLAHRFGALQTICIGARTAQSIWVCFINNLNFLALRLGLLETAWIRGHAFHRIGNGRIDDRHWFSLIFGPFETFLIGCHTLNGFFGSFTPLSMV